MSRRNRNSLPCLEFRESLAEFGASPENIDAVCSPESVPVDGGRVLQPYAMVRSQLSDIEKQGAVFFVPGFGENPISNAPFAITLAKQGFDVVLPGHSQRVKGQKPTNMGSTITARAVYYHDLLDKLGVGDEALDFVTHSLGSLILQDMAIEAQITKRAYLEGASVALVAPAGMSDKDNIFKLGWRTQQNMRMEMGREVQGFSDLTGEVTDSRNNYIKQQKIRAVREVWELSRGRLSPDPLIAAGVGRVGIFGHASDAIFPDRHLEDGVQRFAAAAEAGFLEEASYLCPISFTPDRTGVLRTRTSATHNDEQANPERVAPGVIDFLLA